MSISSLLFAIFLFIIINEILKYKSGSALPAHVQPAAGTISTTRPKDHHAYLIDKKGVCISILVTGHVETIESAKKRLLMKKRTVGGKFEEEAQEIENDYFEYILNQLKARRRHDGSVDIALCEFETTRYYATVVDAPDHRDLIKSLIAGISKADCAVLVAAAGLGGSEAARVFKNGQYALLAYHIGVQRLLIVRVNRLDLTESPYSEVRLAEMKQEVRDYVAKIAKKPRPVAFVPLSEWEGNNVLELSQKIAWFKRWAVERAERKAYGKYLIAALDVILTSGRPTDKALRLPLPDVYQIENIGTIMVGRTEISIFKLAFGNWCDQRTGKTSEANPKSTKSGDGASITNLVPYNPLCEEPLSETTPLIQFFVYDMIQISDVIKSVNFKDLSADKGTKDEENSQRAFWIFFMHRGRVLHSQFFFL